jgi:hypothetical protein
MKSQKSAHGRLANFSERMIKIFWKKKGRHQKEGPKNAIACAFSGLCTIEEKKSIDRH